MSIEIRRTNNAHQLVQGLDRRRSAIHTTARIVVTQDRERVEISLIQFVQLAVIFRNDRHGDTRSDSEIERWGSRESDRRSEEHTSELQSPCNLVCRLLLEKKK